MSNKQRIQDLRNLIQYHNRLYWEMNTPEIDDIEYDKLVRELKVLSPTDNLLNELGRSSASTGQFILNKIKLPIPLLSLDKVYSLEELMTWVNKVKRSDDEKFIFECKYDGMTCCMFKHMAATRGDGSIGENLTDKAPIIEVERATGKTESMVTTLNSLGNKIRVGELLIRNDVFSNIFNNVKRPDGSCYKNQRNAVAGIVGTKDIANLIVQGIRLTVVEYGSNKIVCTASMIEKRWNNICSTLRELPYPQDGVVIKLLDKAYADSLGSTAHHPRGSIAYKFTNQKMQSKIINIDWQVGKEVLTPVAYIEPVTINGSTITKATLHNYKRVMDSQASIGCLVDIERSGDVIPFISAVYKTKDSKPVTIPKYCPACGSLLAIESNGVDIKCINPNCSGKIAERIEAGLKILGVKDIGPAAVLMAIKMYNLTDIIDWFMIMTDEQDLLNKGFGNAQSKIIVSETNRLICGGVSAHLLLASLCIPGIGVEVSKCITNNISLTHLENQSILPCLQNLKTIGPSRARVLTAYFGENSKKYSEYIHLLQPLYQYDNPDVMEVCFTGKMPKTRNEMVDIARSKGYETTDVVKKDLDLLVVADKNITTDKIAKAKQYNIPIKTFEEFMNEKTKIL